MGSCDGLLELFSAYVDRELSAEEIAEVEKHLAACDCCQKFVSLEYETKRLVKHCVEKEHMPPGLKPSILKMIEDECRRQSGCGEHHGIPEGHPEVH